MCLVSMCLYVFLFFYPFNAYGYLSMFFRTPEFVDPVHWTVPALSTQPEAIDFRSHQKIVRKNSKTDNRKTKKII